MNEPVTMARRKALRSSELATTCWRRCWTPPLSKNCRNSAKSSRSSEGELLWRAGDAVDTTSSWCSRGRRRSSVPIPTAKASSPRTAPGGFLGELSLVTGQRPYLTARITESGRVLRIPQTTTSDGS